MCIHLVPEGTRWIPRNQFPNLELEEISLPEGLEEIRAHAFHCCKLRRLVLPSSVRKIGFGAFSACDLLEEITLPEGIESIGPLAFSECESLRTVWNMPKGSIGIGDRAFYEYRLKNRRCPYCGALLNRGDQCSAHCADPYEWTGSLRLYKGLFWWDGTKLITEKIHCSATGKPAWSVWFFGKRDSLGSHAEEWTRLKNDGDPRVKGMDSFDGMPRGRVEIYGFRAVVYLHPDLNRPKIVKKILNEFGLHKRMQGLDGIRIVSDGSMHYRTKDEKR